MDIRIASYILINRHIYFVATSVKCVANGVSIPISANCSRYFFISVNKARRTKYEMFHFHLLPDDALSG